MAHCTSTCRKCCDSTPVPVILSNRFSWLSSISPFMFYCLWCDSEHQTLYFLFGPTIILMFDVWGEIWLLRFMPFAICSCLSIIHVFVCGRVVSCSWPALLLFSAATPPSAWVLCQILPSTLFAATTAQLLIVVWCIFWERVPPSSAIYFVQTVSYSALLLDSFLSYVSVLDCACIFRGKGGKSSHRGFTVLFFMARLYPDTGQKII